LPENKNGLSDIYSVSAARSYALFQPTTVGGYPAAYADLADLRSAGTCALWVGVTDQLAVTIDAHMLEGVNKTNPCAIAEKFGAAMIEHLKGAA
jgi:hypothetical protein